MNKVKHFFKDLMDKNSFFNDISEFEYVTIEDYISDLDNVIREIEDVESTINYYKNRKKILNEWKHRLEINIAQWDKEDNCKNCLFYHDFYCDKFNSSVSEDATCSSFEWTEEDLDR